MLGGGEDADPADRELNFAAKPPVVIMMVGLQGSGKTTTTAKLGKLIRQKHGKKALMASLDVNRPAAQEQLKVLGEQVEEAEDGGATNAEASLVCVGDEVGRREVTIALGNECRNLTARTGKADPRLV